MTRTAYKYKYGRPGTKAARLREVVHERLLAHNAAGDLPTSNRFLFYELVQHGELDKTRTRAKGRGADQDLSDASMWLREEGIVPWGWIVDETRSLTGWRYARSVAEYVAGSVDRARIDCWDGADPPLLICESRTFGGILKRTLAPEYLCPVTATNGQAGGFLHTNVAPELRYNNRGVLYIGDFDWRGHKIEDNTRRVLVQAADRPDLREDEEGWWDEDGWQRIALTAEQVDEHDLDPIQKYDKVLGRAEPAVEVEALGQGVVTGIVRDALNELLPESLEDTALRLKAQREAVRDALAKLNESAEG
jgi:hypothetical protein